MTTLPQQANSSSEGRIPDAPRPVTRAGRRRAWLEPSVRLCWLIAIIMIVSTIVLLIAGYNAWSLGNRLLREGDAVTARFVNVGGKNVPGQGVVAPTNVTIEYTYKGEIYKQQFVLEGWQGMPKVGQDVPVRVDPDNPDIFTHLVVPRSLTSFLVGVYIAAPVALLMGLLTLLMRWLVLQRWRSGVAVLGRVHSIDRSPLAPEAQSVRCSIPTRNDGRLYRALVPRKRTLAPGDELWLIVSPGASTTALAAELYT